MLGQLIPAGGGEPISLVKESIIVGRIPDCDVVVPSRAVSSRHCQLKFRDGYWWVKDLDSRNGTGVNGVRCSRKRIMPGEILCVPKMRFRLLYEAPVTKGGMSDDSLALRVLNDPAASSAASTVVERSSAGVISSQDTRVVPPVKKTDPPAPPKVPRAAPAQSSQKKYLGKLVPKGGGDPIPLLKPDLVIGRSRQADIRLKFSTVSGRHCTLEWRDGYWFVEDLGSSNGVKINGERVDRRHLIPGDQLSISSQRFTIEYTPEGEPPVDPNLTSKSLLEKAGLQDVLQSDNAPAWITSHEKDIDDAPRRYRLDDSDPD